MRPIQEQLQRLVCAEHCRFFKPWADEETFCAAHQWLLARIKAEPKVLDALAKIRQARPTTPLQSEALLLRTTCTHCDYFPYRCDYRNPAGPAKAVPCGGLISLDLLLARELISTQELYDSP